MEPIVGEDQPCRGCGYNLKGLVATGKCPECGRPIRKRRRLQHGECTMTAAPKSWLSVYSMGITLAFCAWPSMIIAAILRCITGSREVALFAFVAGCAWWAGVVISTRPRPEMPDMVTSPTREWFWLRAAARTLSAAIAVPLGVLLVTSGDASSPVGGMTIDVLWYFADLGLLTTAAGFAAFAFYMFQLAHWAGDWQASNKWRAAGVGVVLACLVVIIGRNTGVTEGITAEFAAVPGGVMFVVAFLAFVGVPMLFAFWAIMQQRESAAWAIANHEGAADKVIRDREKLERERADSIAAGPADIKPHIELPNVADSKKLRYNPKTMVPGPAPKRMKFADPEYGGDPDAEIAYGLDPEGTPAPPPDPHAPQRTKRNPGLLYNPKTMTPGPAPKKITNFDLSAPPEPTEPAPTKPAQNKPVPTKTAPQDPGDEQAFDLSDPDNPR